MTNYVGYSLLSYLFLLTDVSDFVSMVWKGIYTTPTAHCQYYKCLLPSCRLDNAKNTIYVSSQLGILTTGKLCLTSY